MTIFETIKKIKLEPAKIKLSKLQEIQAPEVILDQYEKNVRDIEKLTIDKCKGGELANVECTSILEKKGTGGKPYITFAMIVSFALLAGVLHSKKKPRTSQFKLTQNSNENSVCKVKMNSDVIRTQNQ